MTRTRRSFAIMLCCGAVLLGGRRAARAQYLLDTGTPTYTTAEPVPLGFVNVANGNLHLEIPIVTSPQRGARPYVAKMVYDSRIWKIVDTGYSQSWQPTNIPGAPPQYPLGWRFVTNASVTGANDVVANVCYSGGTAYYWYQYQNYRVFDPGGTARRFPIYLETGNACHTAEAGTFSGPSLDATGYLYNYSATPQFIAPDGTKEYFVASGSSAFLKDTNGNYMSRDGNGDVVDTLNRTVVTTTAYPAETDYTVLTSSGSSTVRLIYSPVGVGVATNFGVPGVTEYAGVVPVLMRLELPDGTKYEFTYENSAVDGVGYGLLKSIKLPSGEVVSFTHGDFTDGQGNRNRWVNSMTAGGGQRTFTPATCGTNCNQVSVVRPSGDETVYTFTLNNGAWNTLTKAYSGSAASGSLLLTVQHDYDFSLSNPVSGGSAFVTRTRTTVTEPGPLGNLVKKTEQTYDAVSYSYRGSSYTGRRGNVLTRSEYGFGDNAPGPLLRRQLLSYLHDANPAYTAANIVNRIASQQTQDGAGNKVAETLIAYDGSALVALSGITHHDTAAYGVSYLLRGNPTQTRTWTGAGYLLSTIEYDVTGQPVAKTDSNGNRTTYSYVDNFYTDTGYDPPAAYSPAPPPTNAFLTQVTLPLSGTLGYGYYYASGRRAFAVDQNGKKTYMHFQDALDRPTRTSLAGGGFRQTQYTTATQRNYTTALWTGANRLDQLTTDALARPDLAANTSDPGGSVFTDTVYDSSGRVQSQTNPFRTQQDPTYGSTSRQYDGLNRVTRITHSDGNYEQFAYGPSVTGAGGRSTQLCAAAIYGVGYPLLFVDAAGKKKQAWMDALDRVIEMDEPDSSGTLTLNTCYGYDALANRTRVEQGAQVRLYTYDPLSRITSETTPEGGTVSYAYSIGGTLCSGDPQAVCQITDARGIVTTISYDAENRMTGKTYSNGDAAVAYYYDQSSYNGLTITNGRGRRTGMLDGAGQVAWSFNAEGRVLTERRTIQGVTKQISYAYNLNGSISQITYPSGMSAVQTYDAAGRLTRVGCGGAGSCWQIYFADGGTYAPNGALAHLVLGYNWYYGSFAGITTTYTYNSRLQPSTAVASKPGATLLNLSYSFVNGAGKNNGTVSAINDLLVPGRSQTFTYDELNRLKTAQSQAGSGADCWGQSLNYDRYGNLTSITVTKCTAPGLSLSLNNNNQITNNGVTYDASGNVITYNGATYNWNAENLMSAAGATTYLYDGEGRRVRKSSGKLYWYGLDGQVLSETDTAGNVISEYVYFNGRRIARRDAATGAVYYFITDHIGSAQQVVDAAGNIVEQSLFYPYGDERVITDSLDNNYKFAGLERDPETLLDHTRFRKYSPMLGRWLSPDPLRCAAPDPQALNRYSYANNSPVNFTDPDGRMAASLDYDMGFGCIPDLYADAGELYDASSPCPPGYIPIYGGPDDSSLLQEIWEIFDPLSGTIDWEYANEYGTRFNVYMSQELYDALVANGFISVGAGGVLIGVLGLPVEVEVAGAVILAGLSIYAVRELAQVLKRIVEVITCKLVGGGYPPDEPDKQECIYECDNGSIATATVGRGESCPNPIQKTVIVFP